MIERITSLSNPRILHARKLYDLKYRRQENAFIAEGLKAIGQAFDSKAEIRTLIFNPDQLSSDFGQSLVDRASQAGIQVIEVPAYILESLARKDKPQGILAVGSQRWSVFDSEAATGQGIWVALESVQNPGNLGTIIRTCDAAGAKGLILLDESTDPYDPAAIKASMGSIFAVPHFKTGVDGLRHWLGLSKPVVIGTSDKAQTDYSQYEYPGHLLFLMGSERQGLSGRYLDICEQTLAIPMQGSADSLNLAVATALVVYQAYNQLRSKTV